MRFRKFSFEAHLNLLNFYKLSKRISKVGKAEKKSYFWD